MASVQELIDAANAQKSPAISAMEGLARGYLSGQQQALERAKTLVLLEQNRREQERIIEENKRIAGEREMRRKQNQNAIGSQKDGVFPTQKLEKVTTTYETDPKGNLSEKQTFTPEDNTSDEMTSLRKDLLRAQIDAAKQRQDATEGNLDARKKTILDRNTQLLSKRIEDIGAPEAITQFGTIDEIIKRTGGTPGFGRAESLVPSLIAGDDARSLRQAVQGLQNVKIKDRSGAAVTPQEFVRLKEEFGSGKFKTKEQLRMGLQQALNAYRERTRNVFGGFDEDTKREYLSRNNIDSPLDVLSGFNFVESSVNSPSQVDNSPSAENSGKKAQGRWNPKTGKVEMF